MEYDPHPEEDLAWPNGTPLAISMDIVREYYEDIREEPVPDDVMDLLNVAAAQSGIDLLVAPEDSDEYKAHDQKFYDDYEHLCGEYLDAGDLVTSILEFLP